MNKRSRSPWPLITAIVAVLCLVIALPNSWKPFLPSFLKPELRLGLDLAGGTQLDFRISEDEINARKVTLAQEIEKLKDDNAGSDAITRKQLELRSIEEQHMNLVEAIRNVLERRVNSLGVSETTITPSYIGNERHLLVECPGEIDVNKCIATVGKTIQLEFKEQFSGPSGDYEKGVRAKADSVFAELVSGSGTLQKVGQDLSTTLGVSYSETMPLFESQLTPGLQEFWNRTTTDPALKTEGTVQVVAQNAQGAPEFHEIKGIYIGKVLKGKEQVNHVLEDVPDAMQELQKRTPGATFTYNPGAELTKASPSVQQALSTMAIGTRQVVATGPTDASIVYLLGKVPGTQEMTASHILVQYKGAERAEASVTRTKDEARARVDALKKRLDAGESFDTIAKTESDGPSKGQSGSLGVIRPGMMVAPFEQAAFALTQKGQISAVVETPFGYHIIRADEVAHTANTTVTYHELKITGDGAEAKAKDYDKQIEEKKVEKTENQITLRTIFFSLAPTGWQDTALNGQRFRAASVSTDPVTGTPLVQIQFDEEGSKLFQELTKRNIGKPIAIFVGGELVSAPNVNQEISGGNAVITGSRTLEEARLLAQDLNTGAIPAPIYLSGQNTIEATLGADALRQSVFAGFIGLLVLGAFLILVYRGLGVMADIALAFYVVLMIALLKLPLFLVTSQHIVLTLAGIAGIILSIGMAVDANILAFERFKEEVKKGKLLKTAVETGFDRAWPSVRDGNVSTLITCTILFLIGTSIIRGFSVALSTGILASMFTAIVVTRFLVRKFIASPLGQRPEMLGAKPHHHDQQ